MEVVTLSIHGNHLRNHLRYDNVYDNRMNNLINGVNPKYWKIYEEAGKAVAEYIDNQLSNEILNWAEQ